MNYFGSTIRKRSGVTVISVEYQTSIKFGCRSRFKSSSTAASQGVKMAISPRYDPSKDGRCDTRVPKTYKLDKFHSWGMHKHLKIHQEHVGTKGPQTYHKIFCSLRQHFCYFHGWNYYECPNSRIDPKKGI